MEGRNTKNDPPGALRGFVNLLYNVVIDDESDTATGDQREKLAECRTFLASDWKDEANKKPEGLRRIMLFSHRCASVADFLSGRIKTVYIEGIKMPPPSESVNGILFDAEIAEILKEIDYVEPHFVFDDSQGSLLRVFVMPKGWELHRSRGSLCHECGSFPAHKHCQSCDFAVFCSPTCELLALKADGCHSPDICEKSRVFQVRNSAMVTMHSMNGLKKIDSPANMQD